MSKMSPEVLHGLIVNELTTNGIIPTTGKAKLPMTPDDADRAATVLVEALRRYNMVRKTPDEKKTRAVEEATRSAWSRFVEDGG